VITPTSTDEIHVRVENFQPLQNLIHFLRLVKTPTSVDENAQPFEHIEPFKPFKPHKPHKPLKPLKPPNTPNTPNTFDYLKINIIFVIPILRIQISYQRKIT